MKRALYFSLIAVLSTTAAFAQATYDQIYDRVLLPLVPLPTPLPGAFGSLWQVTALGYNNGSARVLVDPYAPPTPADALVCPQCGYRDPATAFKVQAFNPDVNAGTFVFITKGLARDIALSLRAQDLSRQSETWGTSIPVVREHDVFTTAATIQDIPVGPAFRTAIRVYDFDEAANRQVRVRVYTKGSHVPVIDEILTLTKGISSTSVYPHLETPGHAVLPNVGDRVAASESTTLRISIEPLTPGLRFWPFAATTHNSTQHITVHLPD